jgi:EAL domain-containing protein (putative c-di-GMP-specific phosphodiesterase class I)
VDFASGRIVGAEALIRWDHPEMGRLLPPRFISAAEECGLIVSIGQWVLERACRQAKYWLDQGFPIVVSVNLSAAQFRQRNLLQNIADTLRLSGLEPRYLALEITESILLNGQDSIYETMVSLKELGVKLAIDDFGTGYSSLSYLKRIQVDKLKIDRSFVHEITHDPKDTEIIRAIVAMAKSLELKVVAEGVETAQQFSYLQSIGCDEYQGFYSSQSLSGIEFGQFRYDAGDGSLQSA